MSNEWVRVTDEVTPRREYSLLESQVTEDHEVLSDKPAAYADGTPIPPKYLPAQMSAPRSDASPGGAEEERRPDAPRRQGVSHGRTD